MPVEFSLVLGEVFPATECKDSVIWASATLGDKDPSILGDGFSKTRPLVVTFRQFGARIFRIADMALRASFQHH